MKIESGCGATARMRRWAGRILIAIRKGAPSSSRRPIVDPFSIEGPQRSLRRARGNVIGGGDWAPDRLIPDILRALENDAPVFIRNPLAVRPWQHVLEPIAGYMVLCQALWDQPDMAAQAWNFGPCDEDARPVQWIVERLCALWSKQASWQHDERTQPHEANFLKLDIAKARAGLGWSPRWTLAQALERIVNWHRAWSKSENMREWCQAEVDDYIRAAPISWFNPAFPGRRI